jgi:HK97 family phage major capsid protein
MEQTSRQFHQKVTIMAKVNTKPTDAMVAEAERGLAWREEFGRGGTEVGIARARDIANRKNLSEDTINRMVSFFARHEVDKKAEGFRPGEKGYPSNGRIAWALWGGDAGKSWAKKKQAQFDNDRSYVDARPYPNEHAARLEDPDKYQGFRRKNDAFGEGIDAILGLKDGKAELQAIRFDKQLFTVAEAKAWLEEHNYTVIEFEPASEERQMSEIEAEVTEEVTEVVEEVTEESVDMRDLGIGVEHRAYSLDASPINEDDRRVQIAVSSEEPVERSFGKEILEHSAEAIDLSFLASGRAPLLLDHDPEKQIGVIESVDLDGSARRLRATVRFGKNGLAKEIFDDVVDGIRSNISVGYSINKLVKKDDAYIAKSWKPVEASLVAIPADDKGAGIGRSSETSQPTPPIEIKETEMSNVENTVDVEAVKAEAAKTAQRNAADIVALGARHNQSKMAEKAIAEGRSIEEFRGELLEKIGSERALETQEIGLTKEETKRFSLMRAINALANPHDRAAQEAAKFEFECSAAAAKQYGRAAQGIMLPAEVMKTWKRDLNSADDSALFTDDFRGNDFIDVLRNQSSVMRAGARLLNGLSGDVKIPKKTAGASAAWIASEGGASSESEMTVGSVSMTPKTLGAHTDITRQLMIQSSMDVEALVRDDLAQALALAIDLAGLEGSGSSGQPTGILNASGVTEVTNFAGVNPTFAEAVSLETAVANANALSGSLAYILPSAMYGALKTTEKASGTAQFVVEPGGTINGYNALISNQGTAGNCYFGNFQDLLVGFFGGLDIIVDPYSQSTSGTVKITALQSVDCAVRHGESFAFGNDGV